ncbi:MAG: FIST C-terminal domain-containing protein [Deltaproteobacteria bacterium]|jgi:hypothetical protein|nr:FIST C-terminal domain-containing protein [Deltaproteobacteria bacterium]
MIRTMVAYTKEIDDVEYAVEEMLGQLDLSNLLSETVGIAYCFVDYNETDVVRSVCEKLPFPVIGATTIASAVNESDSPMIFALLVLTSDDVKFRVCLTEPLVDDNEDVLRKAYLDGAEGIEEPPALILTFFPLLVPTSGDFLAETLSRIVPGVPLFGTVCVTLDENYSGSRIIVNGVFFKDIAAYILVYGPIQPRFFLGNLYEEKVLKDKGVVTGVNKNTLISVNDIPAKDYLLQMGLSADPSGNLLLPELFPLVLDLNDGTAPVLRAMLRSRKDGGVDLAGRTKVGSSLSVSSIDVREVEIVTERTMESIQKSGNYDCILLHSCAARFFVAMEKDDELELKVIRKYLDGEAPFIISYSAGEICPVKNKDGDYISRMHNYAIIACVF